MGAQGALLSGLQTDLDPVPSQPGPGTAHGAVSGAVFPGHRVVPAPACVLTGFGLAESALLYTWLPTHRHLQRHDPEGEVQGWPHCSKTGQGWTSHSSGTPFGLTRKAPSSTANLGIGKHEPEQGWSA